MKSDTLGLLRDRGGKLIVTRPAREYPNVAKILATSMWGLIKIMVPFWSPRL